MFWQNTNNHCCNHGIDEQKTFHSFGMFLPWNPSLCPKPPENSKHTIRKPPGDKFFLLRKTSEYQQVQKGKLKEKEETLAQWWNSLRKTGREIKEIGSDEIPWEKIFQVSAKQRRGIRKSSQQKNSPASETKFLWQEEEEEENVSSQWWNFFSQKRKKTSITKQEEEAEEENVTSQWWNFFSHKKKKLQ
jgi:hypothetical protein